MRSRRLIYSRYFVTGVCRTAPARVRLLLWQDPGGGPVCICILPSVMAEAGQPSAPVAVDCPVLGRDGIDLECASAGSGVLLHGHLLCSVFVLKYIRRLWLFMPARAAKV